MTTVNPKYVPFSDQLADSLEDITRMINEHKDMIDAIQEIALELTSAIGTLHTLTLKYAKIANQVLDTILPIIKNVPMIPKKITELLVKLEKFTQNIIDNSEETATTISDVQTGLQKGDVKKIKSQAGALKTVTRKLTSMLPDDED